MKRFSEYSHLNVRIRFGVSMLFLVLMLSPTSEGQSKMPLHVKSTSIDVSSEGIGILIFNLENHKKEIIIPRIGAVHVYDDKGERVVVYRPKKKNQFGFGRAKGDMLSPIQVISVQLPTGRYTIRKVRGYGMFTKGIGRGTPQGKWGFELNHSFDINAGRVVYLGRINGAIVEKDNEDKGTVARANPDLIRSGLQNVYAGFSGSMLKYEKVSAFEEDMVILKTRFPWLDISLIDDESEESTS